MKAKQAIDAGEIGEIIAMKGTNRGTMPRGWFLDPALSGGGALLDHTVHVMDLMHWFTGSKAKQVYAHSETLFHEVDIDDAGMVHVEFENGVFAVLDPSWSRSASFPTWGDVTLEVIGTKGVLSIDAFAQKNEVYSDSQGKGRWSYWGDHMDAGLVDSFITALKEQREVPITGMDGYLSAKVAIAAYESARLGQPVVCTK
jgi:myo-inositol 2-dehydrogenase/D-chiro-inositol 1-dehydrogenase